MDVQPIPVGRRFFFTMLGIATGISLISIVFSFFDPEQVTLKIIFFLFNTESENNIPTWFSAGLWLFLGIAVLLVRAHTERYRASWLVFAVVAMLASLDEFSRLHERLEKIGRRLAAALSLEDVLHWAWVLVGLIIVVFVAVTLTPLVFRLPKTIRNGILLSGFIFVLGAVGFETLGGLARKYEMPIVYILLQASGRVVGDDRCVARCRQCSGDARIQTHRRGIRDQLPRVQRTVRWETTRHRVSFCSRFQQPPGRVSVL